MSYLPALLTQSHLTIPVLSESLFVFAKAARTSAVLKRVCTVLFIPLLLTACRIETAPGAVAAPVFKKEYIDTHDGYSEAVLLTTETVKTLYISGQIGDGETLEEQMRSAVGKLEALLKAQGAGMEDVVKMNTYIVNYGPESLEVFRGVRKELMGEQDMPASTLIGVDALALPQWKIEIEAIAVFPATRGTP